MEFLQRGLPWLFRKRKLGTFERRGQGSAEVEEPPKKKQRLDPG